MVCLRFDNVWLDVVGAYRSPSTSLSNLGEFVEKNLDELLGKSNKGKDCIWLADANINLMDSVGYVDDYSDKRAMHGFSICRLGRRESVMGRDRPLTTYMSEHATQTTRRSKWLTRETSQIIVYCSVR